MQPTPGPDQLTFRLLGPPQIIWQQQELQIPRRQARALLYRLAAEMAWVPRAQLAFLFWPDVPDATARRNLTRLLSYLRSVLPHPDCLELGRQAVRLHPEWVSTDCQALVESVEDLNSYLFPRGVDLVRGRFLSGFSMPDNPEFDHWQAQMASQWEQRYLLVLAQLLETAMQQEDLSTAIACGRRYLAIDELAEEIHRQLISIYGKIGDRAAVTRQFEACTLVLERDLGVSPLPQTRAVYEAALRGSITVPEPEPLKPTWTVLPSLDLSLIGREEAWQSLTEAVRRLASGGLILITGEPGVGKSRLLQDFALSGKRLVLSGNSHLATHTVPYQPLAAALRQVLPRPDLWQDIRPIWLAETARLLPEIRELCDDLPQTIEVEPAQAQDRLFEAITQCLNGLTRGPPLLCLDDLQWADATTWQWLISLTNRSRELQPIILATCRSSGTKMLADVRHAFQRANRLVEVPLEGMNQAAITLIINEAALPWSADAINDFAARLHQATGGNPFFLLETLRTLLEEGQTEQPPHELPLAITVEEAIGHRLQQLTAISQQVVGAAAVVSPHLDPLFLQQTAGRSDMELADALDEMASRHLIRETETGYQFNHELIRTAVYRELSPWRRRILHRRSATALAEHGDSQDRQRLAEVARHFDKAAAYPEAIQAYQDAATAAGEVYAYDEAIRHLQRAIALITEIGSEKKRLAKVHEALAQQLMRVARFEEARQSYRQAIAARPPEPSLDLARLQWRLAHTYLTQLYYPEAGGRLETAENVLQELPEPHNKTWWWLWLEIQLSNLYLHFCLVDIDSVDALAAEIAPTIERKGSLRQQIEFISRLSGSLWLKERYRPSPKTLSLARKELKMARESENPRAISLSQFHLGYTLLHAGEYRAAEDALLAALADARQVSYRMHESRCLAFLSTLYRLRRDRLHTMEYAQLALKSGKAVGSRHYQAHGLANLAWLDYLQGDEEGALLKAQQSATLFAETRVPFAWLAHTILFAIHSQAGRLEPALSSAVAMLDPIQQQLPERLEQTLQEAVTIMEGRSPAKAQQAVEEAIRIATTVKYL